HNARTEAGVYPALPASRWVCCIPDNAMRQFSQPILSVLELRQSSTGATSVAMRRRRVEVHAALARRPSPVGASAMILWLEKLNVLRSVEADSPKPVAPNRNDRITIKPGEARWWVSFR